MTKKDVLNNLIGMVGKTYDTKGEIEIAIIEAFEDFEQNEETEVFTSANDENIIAYINTEDATEFMIDFDEDLKITQIEIYN